MPVSFQFLDPPIERNVSLDVAYDRTDASTLPCSKQTPLVLSPRAVTASGSNSIQPQCGHGVSQAPQPTSYISNESSSGTSGIPDTLSALPSGQRSGVPNLLMPPTSSQLRVEEPEGPRSGDANQAPNESFLEEVLPEKGPMTGGIHIAIFGENFPSTPLYAVFGHNWVRVVSYT
jgi:hypothetical protein